LSWQAEGGVTTTRRATGSLIGRRGYAAKVPHSSPRPLNPATGPPGDAWQSSRRPFDSAQGWSSGSIGGAGGKIRRMFRHKKRLLLLDTRYRYVALGVVLMLILATAIRHGWNMFFENPTGEIESYSFSSLEASKRGTLVCRLDVKPKELVWKGTRIRFDEAWLEERFLETHLLAWFPWNKRVGGSTCVSRWIRPTISPLTSCESPGIGACVTFAARVLSQPRLPDRTPRP
jgi:hypothetical protein